MRRRLGVLGAVALAVPLLALPAAAVPATQGARAAADVCDEANPIVGTPGGVVTGTEEADHILTRGAVMVDALGGNDCIVANPGEQAPTISAGGGDDRLTYEYIAADGRPVGGRYDGGPGHDTLGLHRDGLLEVDLARGTARSMDGVVDVAIAGWESAGVSARTVVLSGDDADNTLRADGCSSHVTGRAGDDTLVSDESGFDSISCDQTQGAFDTFSGNTGDDTFMVGLVWDGMELKGGSGRDLLTGDGTVYGGVYAQRFDIDLADGRATVWKRAERVRLTLSRLEDVDLDQRRSYQRVRVAGNGKANSVTADACRVTVLGRGGDDELDLEHTITRNSCDKISAAAYGGSGADELHGTDRDDRLIGGAGRDVAKGWKGVDTCRAEVEKGCEH